MKCTLQFAIAFIFTFAIISTAFSQNAQQSVPIKVVSAGTINFKALADKELKNPPKLQRQRNNEEKEENLKGIPTNLAVTKDAKIFRFGNEIITPFVLDQIPAKNTN